MRVRVLWNMDLEMNVNAAKGVQAHPDGREVVFVSEFCMRCGGTAMVWYLLTAGGVYMLCGVGGPGPAFVLVPASLSYTTK